ncbi:MAG TPA: hypothetical protein VIV11_16385 [Kofleriaceae bacterium]
MRYLLLSIVIMGCAGAETTQSEPRTTEADRAWLDEVLPLMEANCIGCHSVASVDGIATNAFLIGGTPQEIRDTLLASGVVDVDAPSMSFLLTKGAHMGPHLSADEARAIIDWLEAEAQH